MSLKRGLARESCDFCYRRKIKCDRSLRARQGLVSCTQCALREAICHLDASADVRIKRRRTHTAHCGDTADVGFQEPQSVLEDRTLNGHQNSGASLETLAQGNSNVLLTQCPADLFAEDPFWLSFDSVSFLDQVFMGDGETSAWHSDLPDTSQNEQVSTGSEFQAGDDETSWQDNTMPALLERSSGLEDSTDSTLLAAALSAYFDLAASSLPILIEDAFWRDYHAGHCSQALVYAVACRGMPFTSRANKWDLQQRFACEFRETFLTARSTASDDSIIRLDDLEALALMIDFVYEDDAHGTPLHRNLGTLFLKHESLVLLTLQSQTHDGNSSDSGGSATLARAAERRTLLYWHVYGIDAFHCLDRKQVSRIPDDHAGSNNHFQQYEVKGYFDALLALSMIARKTTRALCCAAAKRQGVDPDAVHLLYEQLYHWRSNNCPPHLRRSRDEFGSLTTVDHERLNTGQLSNYTQLHRAVLWALEINCLMQIECCVSDYGIHQDRGMRAETIATRVEYESVRALQDMIDVCLWMQDHKIRDQNNSEHSLLDLAPSMLRNISAGTCVWSCSRGIELCRRDRPRLLQSSDSGTGLSSSRDENHDRRFNGKQRASIYDTSAKVLRDSVATATSHSDTAQLLERLDNLRVILQAELQYLC